MGWRSAQLPAENAISAYDGGSATKSQKTLEILVLESLEEVHGHSVGLLEPAGVVGSRDDEGRGAEDHERRAGLGGSDLEVGLLELVAGGEEGATEDEEDVGENGAEHGGLDDAKLALGEGEDADDGLDSVCRRAKSAPSRVSVFWTSLNVLPKVCRSRKSQFGSRCSRTSILN